MPRFAANLSFMFNEVPFLDRFDAAAKAGFKAVEFLFPYEHPAGEIAARLKANGLTQALFNLPPGDWTKGERGLAADVFGADASMITENSEMGDLPNWDSGNHVVMIMAIEEEFHIGFSVEEFESMTSFRDVVAAIEQKL